MNSNKAYLYLVKIISARDYSEHKLREKLREKKYPADEIESAISEIKARGYLQEAAFTESRVRSFMLKGYSPSFIRQKLSLEHLSATDEEIEAVFKENNLTPTEQIDRIVRKKLGSKTELDYTEESKILRYLISKGHDFGNSKKVLKSILTNSNLSYDYQDN